MVAVGPVNMPVTRLFVEEIILECRKKHITKVDLLGFEFEMGLFPNVLDEAQRRESTSCRSTSRPRSSTSGLWRKSGRVP